MIIFSLQKVSKHQEFDLALYFQQLSDINFQVDNTVYDNHEPKKKHEETYRI